MNVVALVFLPLLAAIIAGLGNRRLGNTGAKLVTTGALFVSLVFSWDIFIKFLTGSLHSELYPVLSWIIRAISRSTGPCASTP